MPASVVNDINENFEMLNAFLGTAAGIHTYLGVFGGVLKGREGTGGGGGCFLTFPLCAKAQAGNKQNKGELSSLQINRYS